MDKVDQALKLLEAVTPAGANGTYYYGQELGSLKCKDIPQFPGINTLHKLYAVLRQSWRAETAYPFCQSDWLPSDPSYGQCAITATLVCDMFGGSIHRIKVNGGTHYFNKIDGHYIDLTREQFDLYNLPVCYEPNEEISREYCGRNPDTKARYKQLQKNIIAFLHNSFTLANGYSLKDMTGLEEGYTIYKDYSRIEANVSVEKIKEVLQHFIAIHEERLFMVLGLPVQENREKPDARGNSECTHFDVYYLDGCSREECLILLERYGNLLIHDGMCHFGFGGHQSKDEIIADKYNIIGIESVELDRYEGFFEAHGIVYKDKLPTAWEVISPENPGISKRVDMDGMSVYDLPKVLKDQGMYYAETRED